MFSSMGTVIAPPNTTAAAAAVTAANCRIYVGNILFDFQEEDIRYLFERCGAIRGIQMTKVIVGIVV